MIKEQKCSSGCGSEELVDDIKEDFLDKMSSVIRQDVHNHGNKFETYCRELICLMPWLEPHITK